MATLLERKLKLVHEGEQWAKVEEFPDYEVSTRGRVRKWYKHYYRYPTVSKAKNGSLKITFIENKTTNARMVGKLVYETFLGVASNEDLVYLDGDKTNCELINMATVEELVECYKEKQEQLKSLYNV